MAAQKAGMNTAFISAKVLAWARKRSGLTVEQLASRKLRAEDIRAWERGQSLPTETQAEAIAARLGIPYPILLMEEPPPDDLKIPDLRTVTGQPVEHPSLEFRELLEDTRIRQMWCRTERIDIGFAPLSYVAKFTSDDSPQTVAEHMQNVLGIDFTFRSKCENYRDFQKGLVRAAEAAGILVMRSAIVRHSTRRTLRVSEFRGFALSDDVAPVIFINDGDAEAAKVFTIPHELCHLWLGRDGVSDQEPTKEVASYNATEIFCDQVAAEFLVPAKEFLPRWKEERTLQQNSRALSEFFKVSSLVILRRALELGKIPPDVFKPAVYEAYEGFRKKDAQFSGGQKAKKKKGGNFWASFELRNGATFNASVLESVRDQRTSYTEASRLFGVSLATTVDYIRRMSAV